MTFLRDIAMAPLARLTVTIIGSISGVSPTATATAKSNASNQLPLVRPLIRKTRGTITRIKPNIIQVNRVMPLSKLVKTRRAAIVRATWPKAVRAPVSTTTPQPIPLTTALPMKQMFGRSKGDLGRAVMGVGELLDRHGLAGEGRLVDEQIFRRDQPQIGGDHVARRQQDDIAGHDLLDSDVDLVLSGASAPPPHGDIRQHHPAQRVGGLVRAVFLEKSQRDAEENHYGNYDCGALIAEEVGRGRQRQQEQIERIDRSADEFSEDGMAHLMGHSVGANRAKPLPHRVDIETVGRAAQPLQRLFGREARDLAKGFAARGGALRNRRRLAPQPGKDRGQGAQAVLIVEQDHRDVDPGSNTDDTHVPVEVDLAERRIGNETATRKAGSKPDLLTLARTFRRAVHRMTALSRLALLVALDAPTRLFRVSMRSCLLMRRMRMILGLEVLSLMWRTFMISGHEFSEFESKFTSIVKGSL